MHAQANLIGKVGIQTHSRSKGNGIIRVKTHHKGPDRSREAGGKKYALGRHPLLGKYLWIDDDDVRHRQKRGKATQKFLLHGCLVFGELEIAIEQSSSLDGFVATLASAASRLNQ